MKRGKFLPGKGRKWRSVIAGILLRRGRGEDTAWVPGRDSGPTLLGISLWCGGTADSGMSVLVVHFAPYPTWGRRWDC